MNTLSYSEISDLLIQIIDAVHPRTVDRLIEENIDRIEDRHDRNMLCKMANKSKARIIKRMRKPIFDNVEIFNN